MRTKGKPQSTNVDKRYKKKQSAFTYPGEEYSTDGDLSLGQSTLKAYIDAGRVKPGFKSRVNKKKKK